MNNDSQARARHVSPLQRVVYLLLALLVILMPALATLIFMPLFTNGAGSFERFVPNSSDEILYWHQIATFHAAGFNGGYYTINETPARAAFSHFYTKGPAMPMFYGTIARLTGWQANSSPAINLVMISLALAVFVAVTRPDIKQLVALGLLLLTFWALLLYLPRIMQEALHNALAIIFAAIFYVMLKRGQPLSLWAKAGVILLILAASFVRGVTWALLYVPFFVVDSLNAGWSWRRIMTAGAAAGVFTAIAFFAFLQVSLPESNFVSSLGTSNGIESFIRSVRTNIEGIVQGRTLEIAQRYEVMFIAGLAGVGILRGLWKRYPVGATGQSPVQPQFDTHFKENIFHFLNLSVVFAAIIAAYDMFSWRDYRIIAPHLLVSLLLLVAFRRWRLVVLVILVGALTFPKFRESYPVDSFTYPPERIAAFADDLDGALVYDAEQTNAWCNTLLLHGSHLFGPELTTVPAGIGLSVLRAVDTMPDTLKSRYVLIDDNTYAAFAATLDAMPLEPLAQTELGTLYLNGDADCE